METTDDPGSKSGLTESPGQPMRPKWGFTGGELYGATIGYALSYAVIYVDRTGLASLIGAIGTSTALVIRKIAPEAAFARRSWSQANDRTWQHKYEREKAEKDECLEDRSRQNEQIARMQRSIKDLQDTVDWLMKQCDYLKRKQDIADKEHKAAVAVENEILINNEVIKEDDNPPTR